MAVDDAPAVGSGWRLTHSVRDTMYLMWIGLVLVLLKWLELGPVASVSWWWILAPLGAAFLWFEVFEKMFGRDRRKVDAIEWEKRRRERVAQQFEDPRRR